MVDITALLNGKISLSKDDVAKLLQTTPGALDAFEKSYRPSLKNVSDNFFEINAKQASAMGKKEECNDPELIRLKENIINELLDQTIGFCYDGKKGCWFKINPYEAFSEKIQTLPITLDDIKQFPEELQPQVTGFLMWKTTLPFIKGCLSTQNIVSLWISMTIEFWESPPIGNRRR